MALATNRPEVDEVSSQASAHEPNTRLRGSWVKIARSAWVVFAATSLAIVVAGLVTRLMDLGTVHQSGLPAGWTAAALAAALEQLGLTLRFYLLYNAVIANLLVLGFFLIAYVIYWRRSDDWMALEEALAVPLVASENQKPLGRLCLGRRSTARDYSELERRALDQVAGIVATAINQDRN